MQACDWLRTCHENSKGHDLHLTQKVMTLLKQVKAVTDTKEKCEICQACILTRILMKNISNDCENYFCINVCCRQLICQYNVMDI